jgi:dihydroneopterin aldolase
LSDPVGETGEPVPTGESDAGGPGSGPDRPWQRRSRGNRIEIRDLRTLGVHGVLPAERERAQPFSLDLDVWLCETPAAVTDDLADTVDYGDIVLRTLRIVETRKFALLEALAGAIADEVLAVDRRVIGVSVAVRKLKPPLPAHMASIGVRVVRRRTE